MRNSELRSQKAPIIQLPARKVYLILSGGVTLANAVMFTILSYYYVTRVGMNPLQLVLVGTVLEGTILIFEVPTGVVADTFSRRLSVTIGIFILGAAWLIEGSLPIYGMILVAEVIRGVGETFLSGADDAWLADEVGEENVGAVYLHSGQVNRVVGICGALVSAALASWRLNFPIQVAGGIYLVLGVFLLLAMPETGFQPKPREAAGKTAGALRESMNTFRAGARIVRGSSLLLTLLLINAIGGVASEGWDRLWEAHLLLNIGFPKLGGLTPVIWYSLLSVAGSLFSLLTTGVLQRRMEAITREAQRSARMLLVLSLLHVGIMIVFALSGSFGLAVAALLVNGAVAALYYPLYNAWLVQQIEPSVRATVLSMTSQTNALGQVIGGPGIGAVGSAWSMRVALVLSSLLLAPAAGLYARVARRGQSEVSQPAELAD